jgi:hypothetical protein
MKYALILLAAVALLMGCGHMFGNDPEGVTGGHEGGYGSFGSSFDTGYYPDLLGSWQQNGQQGDYNLVTFRSDGTVKVDFYVGDQHQSAVGGYFVSGNSLDVNVAGWISGSQTMTADGNTLNLTGGNGTTILHKIG